MKPKYLPREGLGKDMDVATEQWCLRKNSNCTCFMIAVSEKRKHDDCDFFGQIASETQQKFTTRMLYLLRTTVL